MANAPIEAKVRWSAITAVVLGVIITGLNSVGANSSLLAPLPQWAQSIVTLLAPPVAVLLAGWAAPHSPRAPSPALVAADPAPIPAAPPVPPAVPAVVPEPIVVAPVAVPAPQAVDPTPGSTV